MLLNGKTKQVLYQTLTAFLKVGLGCHWLFQRPSDSTTFLWKSLLQWELYLLVKETFCICIQVNVNKYIPTGPVLESNTTPHGSGSD